MTNNILKIAESYVFELLKNNLPKTYVYHNFLHTRRVVESATEIINSYDNLKDEDKLIIQLAAWFHDVGHISGPENHEEKSVKIASTFLKKNNISIKIIDEVSKCILATKLEKSPESFNEEVIKDADTSHLAKKYYNNVCELLRQELKAQGIANYSGPKWTELNIKLFSSQHKFYTLYAVNNWEKKKNKHLKKLLKKQKEYKKTLKKESYKAKEKAKYKNENPERAIQSLYRVTLRNHIKLSDIADTKANILLSVNAIIISLALANLIPKLDSPTNHHLIIPSLVLVVFSVASVILSILSTRPKVTTGEFTKEQVMNRDVNLLFFGNFHKMPYETFKWGIQEVIKDKDYIYEMLTKDLYYLGVVLHKKYKLLKVTYVVFTVGIIISVIVFIVAFFNLEFAEEVTKVMSKKITDI